MLSIVAEGLVSSVDQQHLSDRTASASTQTMSKLVTGVALGTSGGTILNGVLTSLSPDEWSAIGVLAGIAGIIITGLINWYFKRKVANAQVKALEKYGPAVKVGED